MKLSRHPLTATVLAVVGAAFGPSARAASASATVPIIMNVNAPVCTVANDNASINLPAATSASMTTAQYFSANAISTAALNGSGTVTSASLNQTATISCSLANVSVQSFVVKPSASATLHSGGVSLGMQNLIDATPTTPVKAAGGTLALGAEQVSVNGSAAAASYGFTTVVPYTTAFATGALASGVSTAAVVWRPYFTPPGASAIGSPVGGAFTGSYDIVVNY